MALRKVWYLAWILSKQIYWNNQDSSIRVIITCDNLSWVSVFTSKIRFQLHPTILVFFSDKFYTFRFFSAGSMMQILQQLSGINTFMYYSASILLSSGIGTTSEVIWLAVIPAAANFIFTFAGMTLIERVGYFCHC